MKAGAATWATLRFPREVSPTQGLAALLAINGQSTPKRGEAVVWEITGNDTDISFRLRCPDSRARGLHRQLQAAVPGLAIETTGPPPLTCNRSWRAWQSTSARSLNVDQADVIANGLLTALAAASVNEQLVLQWWLGPVHRPAAVANKVSGTHRGNLAVVLGKAALGAPADLDSDAVRGLRQKRALPGWRAVLRIGVLAGTPERQRQLLGGLAAAVRVAQGVGVQLGFSGSNPVVLNDRRLPWRWPVHINAAELLGLAALPLGDTGHLPITRVRSRLLPPSRQLARTGYILGEASLPGASQSRPLALPVADSLKHLHIVGATGSGKSTLALHLIAEAMAANRSVIVIEPKDLIEDVLARVPAHRIDDVVIIDPATDGPVIGFNPLAQPGVPGELLVDQVLSVFKGLFGEAIGPRTQDILTAGLLTLVAQPISSGARSLVALPMLFTDRAFRASLLKQVRDPLGLAPFWAWWDSLGPNEQAAVLAAPMNKLRAFLVRGPLRRTVGQAEPRFDLREVFTKRRIVLFSLRRGVLGPETANLLGSLALSMVWQATLGRATTDPNLRHPVLLVADEFQDFTHLSQDFGEVLVQARSLGLGLVLSHQFLAQISDRTLRTAVLSNARSRVVFTVGHDDATHFAKLDHRLAPEDFTGLGAYETYSQIMSGNETQPYASMRTLPAPETIADPGEIRRRSTERWGIPATEVDAQLERLLGIRREVAVNSPASADGFGVKKRPPKPPVTEEEQP